MVKPAVDKLPLMARKAIKDTWDVKKPEYDNKLSTLLGQKWEFNFNPALVYANVSREDLLNRLGEAVGWYADSFLHNIEYWLKNTGGSDGKANLNLAAPKHEVIIEPQTDSKFGYGGVIVKDGSFAVVFADGKFGSNVQQITSPDVINNAVNEALIALDGGSTALTPDAKNDIEKYYTAKIESVRSKIAKLVNIPAIELVPNFEENASSLSAAGQQQRIKSIGQATFDYFSAVQRALDEQKFGSDEMLQEGFADVVNKGKISVRIIASLKTKKYNETSIEDGTLWIDVTPATWWSNTSDAGQGIIKLL